MQEPVSAGYMLPSRFRLATRHDRLGVGLSIAASWAAAVATIEWKLSFWVTLALAAAPAIAATLVTAPRLPSGLRLSPAALTIAASNAWLTFNWPGKVTLLDVAVRCALGAIPGLMLWLILKPEVSEAAGGPDATAPQAQ